MSVYPQFSFWILISLAEICFFHAVTKGGTVRNHNKEAYDVLQNTFASKRTIRECKRYVYVSVGCIGAHLS